MPANPAIGREGAFQVYRTLRMRGVQIRARERLGEKIEGEMLSLLRRDRETTAIHRHAVADPHLRGDHRRSDLQLRAAVAGAGRSDGADFFN